MTSPTTSRLHIVCSTAARAVVNDTLRFVDPTSTGDPISAELALLSAPAGAIVGYGGTWAMDDTTSAEFRRAIRAAGWNPRPTASELTIWTSADTLPLWGLQRVYVMQGNHPWDPTIPVPGGLDYEEALARLGLAPRAVPSRPGG